MFRRKYVTMKLFKRTAVSAALCLIICNVSIVVGSELWTMFFLEWLMFLGFVGVTLIERDDRQTQIYNFPDGHTELADGWDEETGLPIRERIHYRCVIVDPHGAQKENCTCGAFK